MAPKQKTDTELWSVLEGLPDDLLDPEMSDGAVSAELSKLGLDSKALALRGAQFVSKLREKKRLAWRDEALKKREALERRAARTTSQIANLSKEQLLQRLNELRAQSPKLGTAISVAARKRKPEESTADELRALLEDMEQLRAIEDDEGE